MPSIFITAANASGFTVGTTQTVTDAVALAAEGGNWGMLSSRRLPNGLSPLQDEFLGNAAPGGAGSFGSLTGNPTDNAPLAAALATNASAAATAQATANAAATTTALVAEATTARAAEAAAQATANAAIPATQKGAALGVSTLDGSGHVPMAQIPVALVGGMNWQGTYNAATNTPALVAGNKGYFWTVSTAGTSLGFTWVVGDKVMDNGTSLEKIDGNPSEVTGVGVGARTGNVVLTTADLTDLAATLTTPITNNTTRLAQLGNPIAVSAAITLAATPHNGANLVCTSTPVLTVNSGLVADFGCSIKGAFTTAGTAAITDLRATTGTAYCCLVQSDAAGTGLTYDLVGTK